MASSSKGSGATADGSGGGTESSSASEGPGEASDEEAPASETSFPLDERVLLEGIFNTSATAITVLDEDGRIVRANERAVEVMGLSRSAVEGRTYDDPRWEHQTLSGEPVPEEEKPFVRVMTTEAPVHDVEQTITWPDGRRRILSIDGAPLRDDEGRVAGAVFVIDDITDKKEVERALRDREERLRSITQNISDGIYRSDPDEGIVYANEAFVRMFGYESLDEIRECDPSALYVSADERERLLRIEEEEGSLDGVEVEFERRDGTSFVGLLSSRAVRDEDGTVVWHDGVVTDITERKAYEQEMAERAALERIIVDISNQFISAPIDDLDWAIEKALGTVGAFVEADRSYVFLVDSEAQTTSNTHEWCAEGIPPHRPTLQDIPYEAMSWFMEKMHRHEPLVTSSVADLPAAAASLQEILEDGNIQSLVVLPMIRGDTLVGFIGFDAVREQRSWDPETVTILRVLGDAISSALHRKEMETNLRAAKEEAEEASVLKSAMLANMSHEIRTPLTSIVGLSEVLEENLDGDPAELADIIRRSSQRLQETLSSVLQLSKLEAGAHELDREPVDLAAVVDETVKLLHPSAVEQSVEVEVDVPERAVTGALDEGALQRILTNLVENAIKFTPPDGTVTVRVRATAKTARLEVDDTGIGIDEDFLPDLFNAFEQENGGIDRTHEGSGLGLAITKRLTEALGGTIEVNSEKGEGTRFTVRLPRNSDDGAENE